MRAYKQAVPRPPAPPLEMVLVMSQKEAEVLLRAIDNSLRWSGARGLPSPTLELFRRTLGQELGS